MNCDCIIERVSIDSTTILATWNWLKLYMWYMKLFLWYNHLSIPETLVPPSLKAGFNRESLNRADRAGDHVEEKTLSTIWFNNSHESLMVNYCSAQMLGFTNYLGPGVQRSPSLQLRRILGPFLATLHEVASQVAGRVTLGGVLLELVKLVVVCMDLPWIYHVSPWMLAALFRLIRNGRVFCWWGHYAVPIPYPLFIVFHGTFVCYSNNLVGYQLESVQEPPTNH